MTHALFLGLFHQMGAGVLGFGLWSAHRSLPAADWPVGVGTMTSVALATGRGDGDGAPTHHVQVAYTCELDGRKYDGNRLALAMRAAISDSKS